MQWCTVHTQFCLCVKLKFSIGGGIQAVGNNKCLFLTLLFNQVVWMLNRFGSQLLFEDLIYWFHTKSYKQLLTITSCNEISHAAGLEESAKLAARVEHIDEFDHFHKTQTDYGRFSVVTEAKAIHETCSHGDNVLRIRIDTLIIRISNFTPVLRSDTSRFLLYLQCATNFHGIFVVNHDHSEVFSLDDVTHHRCKQHVSASDCSLTEFLFSHLKRFLVKIVFKFQLLAPFISTIF